MRMFGFPLKGKEPPSKTEFIFFLESIYGGDNRDLKRYYSMRERIGDKLAELGRDQNKWRMFITGSKPRGLDWTPERWLKTSLTEFLNARFLGLSIFHLFHIFNIRTEKGVRNIPKKRRQDILKLGMVLFPDNQKLQKEFEQTAKIDQKKKELGSRPDEWRQAITRPIREGGLGWTDERWLSVSVHDLAQQRYRWLGVGMIGLCGIFGVPVRLRKNGLPQADQITYLELGLEIFPKSELIRAELRKSLEVRDQQEALGRDQNKWRAAIAGAAAQGGLGWTEEGWLRTSHRTLIEKREKWFGVGLYGLCDIFDVPIPEIRARRRMDLTTYLKLGEKIFPESERIKMRLQEIDKSGTSSRKGDEAVKD